MKRTRTYPFVVPNRKRKLNVSVIGGGLYCSKERGSEKWLLLLTCAMKLRSGVLQSGGGARRQHFRKFPWQPAWLAFEREGPWLEKAGKNLVPKCTELTKKKRGLRGGIRKDKRRQIPDTTGKKLVFRYSAERNSSVEKGIPIAKTLNRENTRALSGKGEATGKEE